MRKTAFESFIEPDENELPYSHRQANVELLNLFRNIREAFFTVDMVAYKVVQLSKAAEDIYGYSIEEFKNNPQLWFEVVVEEDKEIIERNIPLMHRGESFTQQYRIICRDGRIKWVESKIWPTLNENGQLVRIDGVTADISERKTAELALEASENKFRTLIQHSTDMIFHMEDDGTILFASDSFYRCTGYTAAEVIGRTGFSFVHPDDLPAVKEKADRVKDNPGEVGYFVNRQVKKDGSFFWSEGRAVRLPDSSSMQGVILNFRDITERMQYQEKLEQSNEELVKANEELDRFVYMVSHDLRSPLASMMGIVSLAELISNNGELGDQFSLMKKCIRKMDNYIKVILSYSRNSRTEVMLEEVNVFTLASELVQQLQYMDENRVRIQVAMDINWTVKTDRSRLEIVLSNLLGNAIKYADADKAESLVTIRGGNTATGFFLEVEDNGVGIAEDQQEKVFDMFYRISQKSGGSGLGLYIVKMAVAKTGGQISLLSRPGEGSLFRIEW